MTATWRGTGTWDDQIGTRGQRCPHLSTEAPEFTHHFDDVIAAARAENPLAWDESQRRWFVLGGDLLVQVAQDWETFSSAYGVGGPQYPQLLPMDSDDPEHREWRRPMNPLFTRATHELQRGEIRKIAESLIGEFIEDGRAEVISRFCRPLPGRVFFQLIIDLPHEDLEYLQHIVEVTVDPSDRQAQQEASVALATYVRNVVEARRAAPPTDDLIGRVVFAEVGGQQASVEDAVSVLMMVIMGGLETTTNTLAGSLEHLARDPELLAELRENPKLLQPAVEEFLRLYSPTSYLTRYVTEDAELAGLSVKKGQRVALSFASANRDPEVFESPREFRLDRDQKTHYAFGIGPHRCMGSNLARIVMHEALAAFLDLLDDVRPAPGYVARYRIATVRSLETVELTFSPRHPHPVEA